MKIRVAKLHENLIEFNFWLHTLKTKGFINKPSCNRSGTLQRKQLIQFCLSSQIELH